MTDLLKAAVALRDDMLMRAKMNARLNDGEVVVEAGTGVWVRFNQAIMREESKGMKRL